MTAANTLAEWVALPTRDNPAATNNIGTSEEEKL